MVPDVALPETFEVGLPRWRGRLRLSACHLTELRTRKYCKSHVAKARWKTRPLEAIDRDPTCERLRRSLQPIQESLQFSVEPFLEPRLASFAEIQCFEQGILHKRFDRTT